MRLQTVEPAISPLAGGRVLILKSALMGASNPRHPSVTFVERFPAIFSCNEWPQRKIRVIEETP